MMRITSVSYSRLRSLPGYENEKIGASALVEENEAPEDALAKLQTWVEQQLGAVEAREVIVQDIEHLRWRRDELEREVQLAEKRWERAKTFLKAHGLDVPEEIPF